MGGNRNITCARHCARCFTYGGRQNCKNDPKDSGPSISASCPSVGEIGGYDVTPVIMSHYMTKGDYLGGLNLITRAL